MVDKVGELMEFSKVQKRFVNSKGSGYQLLKGKGSTGKTTAAIYRAINLENNYCIYEEDKILIASNNFNTTKRALEAYEDGKDEGFFYSLFSLDKDRVNILSIEDIIRTYSNGYKRSRGISLKYLQDNKGRELFENLNPFIEEFKEKCRGLKALTNDFLFEEVNWIKACAFSKEEYLDVTRPGRGKSLRKNSPSRTYIYELMELYNSELMYNGFMDEYDEVLWALKHLKEAGYKYTHIIIDDAEKLTRGEMQLLKTLFRNKKHSSLIFIVNPIEDSRDNTWIRKGRKIKEVGDFKGKTYNFRSQYNVEKREEKVIEIPQFKYIDLNKKKEFKFKLDYGNSNKELFLEDETIGKSKLMDIPVYNEIAAGSPIEINEQKEFDFSLPKEWLGKNKDLFILKVKGDSMIEKNICDGDLVLIKRQTSAYHNDIVAANLEGEATLKILKTNEKEPVLMPANSKYKAIKLAQKELSIMGVAVGIIKN